MDRRTVLTLLAASTAAPKAFAGCSNDTLAAAFPREVRTLDGNYADLRESDILRLLVDEALFTVDPNSGQPVLCSAKSHEYRDATTWRDDARFHDGGTMSADLSNEQAEDGMQRLFLALEMS